MADKARANAVVVARLKVKAVVMANSAKAKARVKNARATVVAAMAALVVTTTEAVTAVTNRLARNPPCAIRASLRARR